MNSNSIALTSDLFAKLSAAVDAALCEKGILDLQKGANSSALNTVSALAISAAVNGIGDDMKDKAKDAFGADHAGWSNAKNAFNVGLRLAAFVKNNGFPVSLPLREKSAWTLGGKVIDEIGVDDLPTLAECIDGDSPVSAYRNLMQDIVRNRKTRAEAVATAETVALVAYLGSPEGKKLRDDNDEIKSAEDVRIALHDDPVEVTRIIEVGRELAKVQAEDAATEARIATLTDMASEVRHNVADLDDTALSFLMTAVAEETDKRNAAAAATKPEKKTASK